jgi:hypothetical protein
MGRHLRGMVPLVRDNALPMLHFFECFQWRLSNSSRADWGTRIRRSTRLARSTPSLIQLRTVLGTTRYRAATSATVKYRSPFPSERPWHRLFILVSHPFVCVPVIRPSERPCLWGLLALMLFSANDPTEKSRKG